MTVGTAVFDASPLIAFHQINRLELLPRLFRHFAIPPVVAEEIAHPVRSLPDWIDVRDVRANPPLSRSLDAGERAAIALAVQLPADFVILDDLAARTVAVELGLSTTGSLGLLVRAKRYGLIRDVRPLMDAMIAKGLFVSEYLRREILADAGEGDPR